MNSMLSQSAPSSHVRAENFLPQLTLPCGIEPQPQHTINRVGWNTNDWYVWSNR
ncbi:MAG: hypothetical protein U0Y96_16560 [Candidatus Kapaibacterium sp.]